MSPRPRTVEDSAILEAAVTVLGRIGPERMTLADVGEEAGLSAATLVQRFGSKRDLLLSTLKFTTDGLEQRFSNAMTSSDSPLEALFAAAMNRVPVVAPSQMANMLSFYLSDLGDPDFHALAVENSTRATAGFKRLLDQAVAEGELSASYVDTSELAKTIYSLVMGTLVTWAVSGEGTYRANIRNELDILMRPFRRGPRKASVTAVTDETGLNAASAVA